MWKIILLSTVQCLFLSGGQVFLKFAMNSMEPFRLSAPFFRSLFANWYLLASGICMAIATLLWLYILKLFDFSVAYPMISISYIFGMLAAIFIFHETIPPLRWLGVLLIMAGVTFIARPAAAQRDVRQATAREEYMMKSQIEEASRKITTLQCNFTQVKNMALLNDKLVSEGRMYYRPAPLQLRWEYLSPYRYTFVLNNETIQMQSDSSLNTIDAKSSKFFQEIIKIMISGITADGLSDTKRFKTRYSRRDRKGLWEIHLIPVQKEMKQIFTIIILTFSAEDYTVQQIAMHEPGGDTTHIRFVDKQTNLPLEDNLFHIH